MKLVGVKFIFNLQHIAMKSKFNSNRKLRFYHQKSYHKRYYWRFGPMAIFPFITIYFFLVSKSSRFSDFITITTRSADYKIGNETRIFDTFMYNNEGEMAYIRMWRLYDYVDRFIILVSPITHSGIKKNVSFYPFEREIEQYMDKVDIVVVPTDVCTKDLLKENTHSWCNEIGQRDYAVHYIEEYFMPTTNDLIIIADADEIITRDAVKYIKKNPPETFYHLNGPLYFPYYFHKVENWMFSAVARYSPNMKTLTYIRYNNLNLMVNRPELLVTHCSYCFKSIEEYKNKLKSFGHQEFNKEPYITNDYIFKSHYCREKIKSPIGSDEKNTDWSELIPNDERLRYLYDPSFEYDITKTSYKPEDLPKLCSVNYSRKPFDQQKYQKKAP